MSRHYPLFKKQSKTEYMVEIDSFLQDEDDPDTEIIVGAVFPVNNPDDNSLDKYAKTPVFRIEIPFQDYGHESDNAWAHTVLDLYEVQENNKNSKDNSEIAMRLRGLEKDVSYLKRMIADKNKVI